MSPNLRVRTLAEQCIAGCIFTHEYGYLGCDRLAVVYTEPCILRLRAVELDSRSITAEGLRLQHIAVIVVVVLYLGFGGCRVKVNLEVRNWLRFGELNIPYGAVVHIGERLLVGKCACQSNS